MTVIERLDETIRQATDSGAVIQEIDLTNTDYAELMEFANQFDHRSLEQMKLDMQMQSYKDYPLKFSSGISQAELDNGNIVFVPDTTDDITARI